MARQVHSYFTGRKGNVVGSTWKGIPYLRFEPDEQKQSPATIESGKLLGLCSSMGAGFRKAFAAALQPVTTRQVENAFTGALKKWMQTKPFDGALPSIELPYLQYFEFSETTPLQNRMRVPVSVQQNGLPQPVLHIPAYIPAKAIAAPAYTTGVHVTIAAACCCITDKTITGSHTIQFAIAYDNTTVPAQHITLPFNPPLKSLTLVVIGLTYKVNKKGTQTTVTDKRWMPCGIAAGLVV